MTNWKDQVSGLSDLEFKPLSSPANWNSRHSATKKLNDLKSVIFRIQELLNRYEEMVRIDGGKTATGAGAVRDLIAKMNELFEPALEAISSLKEDAKVEDYRIVIAKLNTASAVLRSFLKNNQRAIQSSSMRGTMLGRLLNIVIELPNALDKMAHRVENITMMTTKSK